VFCCIPALSTHTHTHTHFLSAVSGWFPGFLWPAQQTLHRSIPPEQFMDFIRFLRMSAFSIVGKTVAMSSLRFVECTHTYTNIHTHISLPCASPSESSRGRRLSCSAVPSASCGGNGWTGPGEAGAPPPALCSGIL